MTTKGETSVGEVSLHPEELYNISTDLSVGDEVLISTRDKDYSNPHRVLSCINGKTDRTIGLRLVLQSTHHKSAPPLIVSIDNLIINKRTKGEETKESIESLVKPSHESSNLAQYTYLKGIEKMEEKTGLEALGINRKVREPRYNSISAIELYRILNNLNGREAVFKEGTGDKVFVSNSERTFKYPYEIISLNSIKWIGVQEDWLTTHAEVKSTRKPGRTPAKVIKSSDTSVRTGVYSLLKKRVVETVWVRKEDLVSDKLPSGESTSEGVRNVCRAVEL